MHPETFLGASRDEPIAVVVEAGSETLYDDELGELGVQIFLEEAAALGGGSYSETAAGWAGDRFALFESASGDGVVWFVLWDSPEDRDRFSGDLVSTGWAQSVGAEVESLHVGDRPAVRITRGVVPATTARTGS